MNRGNVINNYLQTNIFQFVTRFFSSYTFHRYLNLNKFFLNRLFAKYAYCIAMFFFNFLLHNGKNKCNIYQVIYYIMKYT